MSITCGGLIRGALTLLAAVSINTAANNIIKEKFPTDTIRANVIYVFCILLFVFIVAFIYNKSHETFSRHLEKFNFINNPTKHKHWQNNNYAGGDDDESHNE